MAQPQQTTLSLSQSTRVLLVLVFSVSYSLFRLDLTRYVIRPNTDTFDFSIISLEKHDKDYNENVRTSFQPSPACRPHFQLALPDGQWTNITKFKRLYFYHVRKAGGTTLRRYFEKVAAHHGLTFRAEEYNMAEDPSSRGDEATFYVTHLREPVSRSISHFKYEGRWDCKNLIYNTTFIPTEDNANKLETWNQTHGHKPSSCLRGSYFKMATCAVNCYTQWFSGFCPTENSQQEVPMTDQLSVAKTKLLRYNMIVITELLQYPKYIDAVEQFFGVPGLIPKRDVHPWCEVESHYSNERVPLVINNVTLESLIRLNTIDISLYHDIRGCLNNEMGYNFPRWNEKRFESNKTMQVDYNIWEQDNRIRGYSTPRAAWLEKFNESSYHVSASTTAPHSSQSPKQIVSPACKPHFRSVLPDGRWTNGTKFQRLYFYHARKAGGTNLKRYFQKVAAHHGLLFDSDEFGVAEVPGSAQVATFYVTHMREPVSRSLSHFKYEGRWNCQQLLGNASFVPSGENARTLEEWVDNYGETKNRPSLCAETQEQGVFFYMVTCAVNCYIQWMAGLSCPLLNPSNVSGMEMSKVPFKEQYRVAKAKLLRYNFIVISEMLQNEEYVAAVERFFAVPGVSQKRFSPWCEAESHYSNKMFPLELEPDLLKKLTERNMLDIQLYNNMRSCVGESDFGFPEWRHDRFDVDKSIQIDHTLWDNKNRPHWPTIPRKSWLSKFKTESYLY